MDEAKFVVTPESKQLEFEAALLAHEDHICAEYERKQEAAAAAAAKQNEKEGDGVANGKGGDAANGKNDDDSDRERRGRSRSGGRKGRSRSRSYSRSRSRSRGKGSGGSSRKKDKKKVVEVAPKRGFQEILDKRAVNLGIVFDALVEKAQVKRKEEVRVCLLLNRPGPALSYAILILTGW